MIFLVKHRFGKFKQNNSHKHFHSIDFKYAGIAEGAYFVGIKEFHAACAFVGIVAEGDAALPERFSKPYEQSQVCLIFAIALQPPRHNVSMEANANETQNAIPNTAPKHTKSRLTHGKESPCARRLNDGLPERVGLGE